MSNDKMDRHYREDSAIKADCDAAARALDKLLAQDRRLGASERLALQKAHLVVQQTSAQIVAVWD